jgi:putative transposase
MSVKGMTASAKGTVEKPGKCVQQKSGLNRAMLDVAFGEIRRQIRYKSAWYGATVVEADRFFPSSKRCSCCGEINGAPTLSDRTWKCQNCATTHDRDFNASQNLEQVVLLPEAIGKVTSVRDDHRQPGGSGQKLEDPRGSEAFTFVHV